MIPYCDTPRQSVVISLLAGLVGGVIGIYLQSMLVVVVATVGLAIISEILVHEYRKDDQYVQAKQQLFDLV